jgi:prepilin-type processing-associated H-X9-DG protein
MRPTDLQLIGAELAIKWDDQSESFIRLETLRQCCPCAGCRGEKDILGNTYKNPAPPLTAHACQLLRIMPVGNYALNFVWADGHNTGIYAFDYLKRVAESAGRT